MNTEQNEDTGAPKPDTDNASVAKRPLPKVKTDDIQVVYHWTRLRFYRSRYDSWSNPLTREKVSIGEIRIYGSGRTCVVFKSWQNNRDFEQVQLVTKEIPLKKQEAIARLIQKILADPEKARADLDNSPVTQGVHSHEIKVRLTSGFKSMDDKTKTILEWKGDAFFINGGLLGEIAQLLGDEQIGAPEPLRLPDGRKAIFDRDMNVVEDINRDHKSVEDFVKDMWLAHYYEHKHDWWLVANGFNGLGSTQICVLINLRKRQIDWRAELTPDEVRAAEAALGEILDDYDYKPQ